MEAEVIQSLIVNGGLGTTAAVFVWLYLQEKKDRKLANDENRQLRDQFTEHLKQDIADKIDDRDALNQAIQFVKGSKDVR